MNAVTYTKIKGADNRFNLLANGAVLGEVTRVLDVVPAKREGKIRKTTFFLFTPAQGVGLQGVTRATMKAIKETIEAELPPATPPATSLPVDAEAADSGMDLDEG